MFDKSQHPFLINALSKVGIEKILVNLIKGIYKKVRANIISSDERLNAFPLRSERRKICLLWTYLFKIIVVVLANEIIQEIKGTWIGNFWGWQIFSFVYLDLCD